VDDHPGPYTSKRHRGNLCDLEYKYWYPFHTFGSSMARHYGDQRSFHLRKYAAPCTGDQYHTRPRAHQPPDDVRKWLATAKHPRWKRPYTELVYQPMLEVLHYLRANGYRTFIATGGSAGFVREYSDRVYGISPEQVAGTEQAFKYGYDKDQRPILTREPKLVLDNLEAGKIENFWLMYGRRPYAAFGNSSSDDQQMLEYVKAGTIARLSAVVVHDDAAREYAYGPAQGLPDTSVGTLSQAMYDMAKKQGWAIISMKNDWKRIFS
jgi:haloacid dehalogenase-like hydrolase